jgi:hypothetical protein
MRNLLGRSPLRCVMPYVTALVLLAAPCNAQNSTAAAASNPLPDIAGIRPGMTAQQAYEVLKARAPGALIGVGQVPVEGVSAKPVPTAIAVRIPDKVPAETITVWLTTPPSKQVVWAVAEQLDYSDSNKVLTSTVLDALRKKFGPEMNPKNYGLWWSFDAQGKHADSLPDCINYDNMNLAATNPSAPTFSFATPLMYTGGPRSPCDPLVAVRASTLASSNNSPYTISITLSELDHSLVLASREQYKAYIANAGARHDQEELEKAKQQKGPVF